MKTYMYHLFLRNPLTKECKVQNIEVDSDDEYLTINTLFQKLSYNKRLFDDEYVLIGLNVGVVKEK